MSEPKVTLAEIEDWANRSGITMPGMADTMLRAVYDEVKRLHAENERMRNLVADIDARLKRQYVTLRDGSVHYLDEWLTKDERARIDSALSTSTPSGTEGK